MRGEHWLILWIYHLSALKNHVIPCVPTLSQEANMILNCKLSRLLQITMVCVTLFSMSCSDDPVSPGVGLEVTNAPDNFQYQVSSVKNYTKIRQYIWNNSGTSATVNQACSITGGAATLKILDANGTQVYSHDLRENGTFSTSVGMAGDWTIQVILSNASGTFNFRVQKLVVKI